MFEDEKYSINDLSEFEIEAAINVNNGSWTWDEYFVDGYCEGLTEPPEWLLKLATDWGVDYIYDVETDGPGGSCGLGVFYDKKTGAGWVFKTWTEGLIVVKQLPASKTELDIDTTWAMAREDIEETGSACLYGRLWCNPKMVPRDKIEVYLGEQLKGEGLERLEGGYGPSLKEWLTSNYQEK